LTKEDGDLFDLFVFHSKSMVECSSTSSTDKKTNGIQPPKCRLNEKHVYATNKDAGSDPQQKDDQTNN
jgi:hypothetical protein